LRVCCIGVVAESAPPPGLWRDRTFLTYWSAAAIDTLGDQVTFLAMPLVAVVTLQATAAQTGILRATVALPSLLFGLVAGALIDRLPRRRVLVAANLVGALALASVPAAALVHRLVLVQVIAAAFLAGGAGMFAGLAATAYLPTLVRRDQLVDANGKLGTTSSTMSIVGPSLAGLVVQAVTAPVAIVADVVLTTLAGALYAAIPRADPPPEGRRRHLLAEIGEGIRVVVDHRVLRALTVAVGGFNLFSGVAQAVFVLYMARQLRMPPATIGLVFAAAGPGALAGAVLSRRVVGVIGVGPTIIAGALAFGLGWTIPPFAAGPPAMLTVTLMASQFLLYGGAQLANITMRSLRQAVTPATLLGRVSGTMSFVWQGVVPVGALAGGLVGQVAGPRAALGVAAAGSLALMAGLAFTPLRGLRSIEDAA
jgi:MFS family permease